MHSRWSFRLYSCLVFCVVELLDSDIRMECGRMECGCILFMRGVCFGFPVAIYPDNTVNLFKL